VAKKNTTKTVIIILALGGLATLAYFLLKKRKKVEPLKVLKDAFDKLTFEFNKAIILPISYPSLDELSQTLKDPQAATWKLKIDGHTDNKGSDDYNLKLSQQRADAVKSYLISKGVSADKITSTGFGESKPIASNDTDEGRSKNRRVEFTIEKQDGTLIKTV
jgi:OOP family OmpA-OmpF porin